MGRVWPRQVQRGPPLNRSVRQHLTPPFSAWSLDLLRRSRKQWWVEFAAAIVLLVLFNFGWEYFGFPVLAIIAGIIIVLVIRIVVSSWRTVIHDNWNHPPE